MGLVSLMMARFASKGMRFGRAAVSVQTHRTTKRPARLGLEVLEDRCVPNAGPLPIDFAGANFQPYGGLDNQFNPARVQDRSGTPTVPPAGSSVTLSGNMWKALTIPAPLSAGGNYTITPRTILSFNFSSNGLGEIQASGSIIRRAK